MAAACFSQIQHLASNHNYQPGSSSNRSNRSQRNRKSHNPFHQCRHHSYLWSHSPVPNCNSRRYHMAGSLEDRSLEKQLQFIGEWSWRLIDQLKVKGCSCKLQICFTFLIFEHRHKTICRCINIRYKTAIICFLMQNHTSSALTVKDKESTQKVGGSLLATSGSL